MSANANGHAFDELLNRMNNATRAARLRSLAFAVVPAVAGVALLAYSVSSVNSALERVDQIQRQEQVLRSEVDDARRDLREVREELAQTQTRLSGSRQAVAHVRDGINAFHAGRYDAAVAAYDRALSLDPESPYVANLKGYSLFKGNRLDEALSALQLAVRLDPAYAWGYFDLARVQCKLGDAEHAREAVQRALELRPGLRQIMAADGEFRALCRETVPEIFHD